MKNLLKSHGKEFTAVIYGSKCSGKILVENDVVFLCHNNKSCDGDVSENKNLLGYKYSWYVDEGTKSDLNIHLVDNFKIVAPNLLTIPPDISQIPLFKYNEAVENHKKTLELLEEILKDNDILKKEIEMLKEEIRKYSEYL